MKTMILSTVIAFLITSPVHAVPITWDFSGTTLSNSAFLDKDAGVVRDLSGRHFEFLIFLDSDLMRTVSPAETLFFSVGKNQEAVIQIAGLGILPVTPIRFVEYLRSGPDGVRFVDFQFDETGLAKQGLQFEPPIPTNPFELFPIAGKPPKSDGTPGDFTDDILKIVGPNLLVNGQVTQFAAIPEGGSTALYLTSALIALGFLRRRYKGSAS